MNDDLLMGCVMVIGFIAGLAAVIVLLWCLFSGTDPGVMIIPTGDGTMVPVPTR